MDLVVNHTAKDSELTASRPQWFHAQRRRRNHVALRGRSRQPRAQDGMGRSRRAGLPAAAARRDRRLFRGGWCAIMSGSAFGGFRCDAAYKVPAESVAAADRRGQGGGSRQRVPGGESRCDGRRGRRARRGRLRLSVQQHEMVGIFESPWLLEQYERFRHIAPTIAFPESHDTERLVTELVAAGFSRRRDRGALPPGLCLRRRLLDRCHDADGVRVWLGPAHLRRAAE